MDANSARTPCGTACCCNASVSAPSSRHGVHCVYVLNLLATFGTWHRHGVGSGVERRLRIVATFWTDTDFDGCIAAGDLLNLLGTFGTCPSPNGRTLRPTRPAPVGCAFKTRRLHGHLWSATNAGSQKPVNAMRCMELIWKRASRFFQDGGSLSRQVTPGEPSAPFCPYGPLQLARHSSPETGCVHQASHCDPRTRSGRICKFNCGTMRRGHWSPIHRNRHGTISELKGRTQSSGTGQTPTVSAFCPAVAFMPIKAKTRCRENSPNWFGRNEAMFRSLSSECKSRQWSPHLQTTGLDNRLPWKD